MPKVIFNPVHEEELQFLEDDHTALKNIGTNTHSNIDTALTRLANTSGTNTGDQDLSKYINAIGVVTNVDFTKTGVTKLATVPSGKTLVVTGVTVIVTDRKMTITVYPAIGVGIASGESDIMPSTTLTNLKTEGQVYRYSCSGIYVAGNAGNDIKLGIDTAAE